MYLRGNTNNYKITRMDKITKLHFHYYHRLFLTVRDNIRQLANNLMGAPLTYVMIIDQLRLLGWCFKVIKQEK
jgi:hypothetical protein